MESDSLFEHLPTFEINGEIRRDYTYRTGIIEALTGIEGKSFLDPGCGRGYESYVLGIRGASRVLGIEGRDFFLQVARFGAEYFQVSDRVRYEQHDVRIIDELVTDKFDVVLNFGLLYHMQNPFNLLKRLRNLCTGDLLLETQIAPLSFEGAERGQINELSDLTQVELDGVLFEGRVLEYRGDALRDSKGSLDRPRVFWMTIAGIQKALDLAGFDLLLTVHNKAPDYLEPWAGRLGYNQQRLKAFFHARVREPEKHIPVMPGTISGLDNAPFSYAHLPPVRRLRRRMMHRFRRILQSKSVQG